MKVDIIAVTYHQDEPLKCLINSLKCQTNPNWNLYIIHDGEDDFYHNLKKDLQDNGYLTDQIILDHTPEKAKEPWGHVSRKFGIKKYIKEDSNVTVLTNGDNYHVPIFVDEVIQSFKSNPDLKFLFWNGIHSHENKGNHPAKYPRNAENYCLLEASLAYTCIDMASAAIKNNIVKDVGFNHVIHDADWHFFVDILQSNHFYKNTGKNLIIKTNKVLFVHN